MSEEHLRLTGVTRVYPPVERHAAVHALGPIDLSLRRGEFFSVVGPSGCGKSTLLDVVAGLARTEFYVPGSILRIELDTAHPIADGMPEKTIAWAEDSPVFEVTDVPGASVPPSAVRVVAWYPTNQNPLLSGWLLGAERIKGKAALVDVKMGQGHVILFGFRPQYRAQSLATYPLFFNALNR